MTPNPDTEIRRLLGLYYAGLTTVDDERRLKQLLHENIDALPRDIADDAGCILSMPGQTYTASTAPLTDAAAEIDTAIRRHTAWRRRRVCFASGIAATAAGIILAVTATLRGNGGAPSLYGNDSTVICAREALLIVSQRLNDAGLQPQDNNAVVIERLVLNSDIDLDLDDLTGDSIPSAAPQTDDHCRADTSII